MSFIFSGTPCNLNVMKQYACLVINSITVDGYAALKANFYKVSNVIFTCIALHSMTLI